MVKRDVWTSFHHLHNVFEVCVSGHLNFIRKIPEFVKFVADCSQMIFCLVMNFLNKQNKFKASLIFKGRIMF